MESRQTSGGNLMFSRHFPSRSYQRFHLFFPQWIKWLWSLIFASQVRLIWHALQLLFMWGCGVWRFSRWRGCLTDRRCWFHFLAGDFLSGVICSSCVCADVPSGYFGFLNWRARWNVSRISWIYFRCPSGKELIDVWEEEALSKETWRPIGRTFCLSHSNQRIFFLFFNCQLAIARGFLFTVRDDVGIMSLPVASRCV